ncbi:hypothetical protein BDF20DRAFT_913498 [Mycotypha africana]|uniref:uncharacterized protein n=1 Tax=Mycotypha africana TaxID=64632 RepID=UPI002300DB47|nr:uncharacterized protein BDF20DRAFT_913498 [Mycotypha africana]KAI8977127.1 hypothetical protein BDF20DRAFT_913498 [Mycotypha africana]
MNPSASATKLIHRRATTSSPLNILGHRFLDAFRLKKKIVISMKNTLLWNPSSDINAPNYAFKENAINLIQKLSTSHHLYLLMHYNSTEEYAQIQHIFDNNATINCAVQKDNILFCASVADKLNFLDRIRPDIYVEGDTGHKDGSETIWILLQENHIDVVPKVIWIDGSFAARPLNFMDQATKLQNDRLEYAESVFQSSIASLTK